MEIFEANKQNLEKTLFTTSKPDETSHRAVVVIDSIHAITTQHGVHSLLKEGDKLVLYNVIEPTVEIEVVVKDVNELCGFVILKPVTGKFPNYPYRVDGPDIGTRYQQLEVDPTRKPVWTKGVILDWPYARWIGTTHDNPGCGIYDDIGNFIGFSVAKMHIDFSNLKIDEGAYCKPDIEIVSGYSIYGQLRWDDSDESSDNDYVPGE